jgi:hypothetical protein
MSRLRFSFAPFLVSLASQCFGEFRQRFTSRRVLLLDQVGDAADKLLIEVDANARHLLQGRLCILQPREGRRRFAEAADVVTIAIDDPARVRIVTLHA